MSRSADFGGMYFTAAAVEKLQRLFGPSPTPKAHVPDPMARYNLDYTTGCPCDRCPTKPTCRITCDGFESWVRHGRPSARTLALRAKRKAAAA